MDNLLPVTIGAATRWGSPLFRRSPSPLFGQLQILAPTQCKQFPTIETGGKVHHETNRVKFTD